ncbi:MAG: glycosyltransferase family 39 protein [Pyrinomonadaceae bacterium]
MSRNSLQNNSRLIVWLLIAAHTLIAVPLAYLLPIWSDEGSTLHTTERGVAWAVQNAATFERQAPLYFWFLSLWREINGSIFFARLPSIIASAAAILVFSRICEQYLSRRSTLLATAFFALHPILFWASTEIRVYAFVILISVALMRLFLSGFFADAVETSRRDRVLFTLVALIALYSNYYLGFVLVGLFLALLVTCRWRCAWNYLLLMIVVGIAFLPMLTVLWRQFGVNAGSFTDERSFAVGARQIWGHVLDFILPADLSSGEPTVISVVRLWLVRMAVIVAAVLAVSRRRLLSRLTVGTCAVVATILGCLLLAYFELGREFTLLRHATVLFVPLLLFLGSLLNDVGPSLRRDSLLVTTGLSILVGFFFSYAFITHYPNLAKPGDWARVGAFIQQNESAGEPIVVFHTYDAMTLPYEYRGVNEVLPNDHFLDFDLQTPTPELIRSRTAFTTSLIPPNADKVWLLTNYECGSPGTCDQLENYVWENYETVIDGSFYLQRVRLLRRKQH